MPFWQKILSKTMRPLAYAELKLLDRFFQQSQNERKLWFKKKYLWLLRQIQTILLWLLFY